MLALGVGPSWYIHFSVSLDVQPKRCCLGEFGKLLEMNFPEPHTEPAVYCFVATEQSQTCSTGHIHAVVRDTVQWRGTRLSLANGCSPYLGCPEVCTASGPCSQLSTLQILKIQCQCGCVHRGTGLEPGSASPGTDCVWSGSWCTLSLDVPEYTQGSHM